MTPSTRWEAEPKVRGRTRYSADEPVPGKLHAAIVAAAAPGTLLGLDRQVALAMPGVAGLFGVGDLPELRPAGLTPWLADATVHHAGQAVALVVADTERHARAAAATVVVRLAPGPLVAGLDAAVDPPFAPPLAARVATDSLRGTPGAAWHAAPVQLAFGYETAGCQHHPMEPHASLARWDGDELTVWTSTQAVFATQRTVAHSLGVARERVRVIARQLGGGLGSKGPLWWPLTLRVVQIARALQQPVQLVLTRPEMSTQVGRRSPTRQRLWLGADLDGRLQALVHDVLAETGPHQDYADPVASVTRWLYACPNVRTTHRLVRVHAPQPIPMRAPGESPGSFALETALDELAWRLRLDPIELRRRNLGTRDPHLDRPWSSQSLPACWARVADGFGWAARPLAPRSLHVGDEAIGWGFANAAYPLHAMACSAEVAWLAPDRAAVRCGVQDMGSGTYNALADAVAQGLDLPPAAVQVQLGDSRLPDGPYSAGALVTASALPAVLQAVAAVRARHAAGERWPIVATGRHVPDEQAPCSSATFGAVMAEVRVHRPTGAFRVSRLHGAYAAGRIVSPLVARSQYVGGMVNGLGMACFEAGARDPASGRLVNDQLGDYLLPTHADMPEFHVHLVDEVDPHLPGGAKGVGMVGATGTAAAIANALWHATGRRLRRLPMRIDDLLGPEPADDPVADPAGDPPGPATAV